MALARRVFSLTDVMCVISRCLEKDLDPWEGLSSLSRLPDRRQGSQTRLGPRPKPYVSCLSRPWLMQWNRLSLFWMFICMYAIRRVCLWVEKRRAAAAELSPLHRGIWVESRTREFLLLFFFGLIYSSLSLVSLVWTYQDSRIKTSVVPFVEELFVVFENNLMMEHEKKAWVESQLINTVLGV